MRLLSTVEFVRYGQNVVDPACILLLLLLPPAAASANRYATETAAACTRT